MVGTILVVLAGVLLSIAVGYLAERRRSRKTEAMLLDRQHDLTASLNIARHEAEWSRVLIEMLGEPDTEGEDEETEGVAALEVPPVLVTSCVAGECVLFAGTGVAAAAGQPTWREALLAVLAVCRSRFADPLWQRLAGEVREDQYDLVADLLVERLTRERFFELLREVVDTKAPVDLDNDLLSSLSAIPFSGVITNLWDDLALRMFELRKPQPLLPDATDFARHLRERKFFALPAFGSIADSSLLLTNDALDEYLEDHAAFKRFLASLFGTRSVLFVGTGVAGIEQLLRSSGLRGPGRRKHYALVPRTAEAELHQVRLAKRYNVHLLLYSAKSGHGEAVTFTQTLLAKTNAAKPRERPQLGRGGETLRSVYLRNVGPFAELELDFAEEWTVLLGDNGCGKSTVLRAIALALAGDDERAAPLGGRLLSADASSGSIEVRFEGSTFETRLRRERTRVSVKARQITPVQTGEWLALGFPPVRGLTIRNPEAPTSSMFAGPSVDDVLPLVAGGADDRLDDVTQWLLNAFAAEASRETSSSMPRTVERFFSIMTRLSEQHATERPFFSFDRIAEDTLEVMVTTPDGSVPLRQLSQGMLSVLSWTGTLITRLEDVRHDGVLPDHQAALVLVDELDAHLHPAWQRTIAGAVREEFPNVQVIATTHSPLVVGGMPAGNLWRLHRDGGFADKEALDPARYRGRRFDQILGGAPFDETGTRDPETEAMLRDYKRLYGREGLSDAEQLRLKEVIEALGVRLPTLEEDKDVRTAKEMITKAADDRLAAMPEDERERVLVELRRQLQEAITGSSPSP